MLAKWDNFRQADWSELVKLTNNLKATSEKENKDQIFKLPESIDLPTQTGDFLYAYPEMRCLVDYVGTYFKEQLEQLSAPFPQVKPALIYSERIIAK